MRRLILIAVAVALLLVVTMALVTTTMGLRLVVQTVLPMAPGQLSFATLNGRLTGPIEITGLRWQSDIGQLTIERLGFDWQPTRLPSRHLYIDWLNASGVRWQAPKAAGQAIDSGPPESLAPPLTVTVVSSAVDDVRIDHGGTAFAIDAVRLAVRIDNENFVLEDLALSSPAFDVSGAATLAVNPPFNLDTELTWTARPEHADSPIRGTTIARGDTDKLDIELSADGPLGLELSGQASNLLHEAQIEGNLELERFDPAIAGIEIQSGVVSASVAYNIATDRVSLDGTVLAPGFWPSAALIVADTTLVDDLINIDKLKLSFVDWPTTIAVAGTARTDLSALDLELGWTEFSWPPGDDARFASPHGTVKMTGSPDSYALQLTGAITAGVTPAATVSLRGQGTTSQFEILKLDTRFETGSVNGRGLIDWSESPRANLQIDSRGLDLSQWHEELEGRVGFESTVIASLSPDGARASVDLSKVDGQLRGYALSGSGAFDFSPGDIGIRKLKVKAGQARIEANGRLGEQLDLDWSLDVPDIALFVPGAAGMVRSNGKARGKRSQPALTGELTVSDIRIGSFAVATADSRFDVGADGNDPATISLAASGVEIAAVSIGTVSGRANGTVAQHAIEFEIDGPVLELATTLQGKITPGAWQGQIATLVVGRDDIGDWRLPDAASLTVDRERISLARSCLVQLESHLCLSGELAASGPWHGDFELAALPVATFAPLLPAGLTYEGVISGNGQAASTDSTWAADFALLLPDGRVISREDDEDNVLIGYRDGTIDGRFDPEKIQARMKFDLRDAGAIEADITVPTDRTQQLQGTIQARVENLSIVTALVPQIGRIDGSLHANLSLAGTATSPDLSGRVDLQAAELVLPDLGISLKDMIAAMTTQGAELRFDGSANSGSGRATLTGELAWRDGLPAGRLMLSGTKFRAIDLPEIWLDTSPALTLTVDGHDIVIDGSIEVPAARITPIDFGTGIAASPDQVLVGQATAQDPETRWQIGGSVQVTAGDDVQITAYGLQGRLTGDVLIIEEPDQPTTGRGALEIIDGRYSTYGQKLTIETGRLEFTGGQIDDPGLNLRAVRKAGDVTAGVQVRGPLRSPVLTLYSVPAMSDTQTMSYLITGRGLEELNEIDQTAVNDAATRLALRGGSLLASSLGRGLGLDSVEFQDQGATSSTALVVGKHLSPRLFVSYGIGLFEAINTLRLQYRINTRLTLETQSGASTSADLLYSVEN